MERFAFDLKDEDRYPSSKPLVASASSDNAEGTATPGLIGADYVPLPYDLPAEWEHNPFRANLFTCLAEEEDEELEFLDDEDDLDEDDEDEDLDDDDLEDDDLEEEEFEDEELEDDDEEL